MLASFFATTSSVYWQPSVQKAHSGVLTNDVTFNGGGFSDGSCQRNVTFWFVEATVRRSTKHAVEDNKRKRKKRSIEKRGLVHRKDQERLVLKA